METRNAFMQAINPPQIPSAATNTKKQIKDILQHPIGQALVGALIACVILYVVNPPFVQSQTESGDVQYHHRSVKKILVWAALTASAILLIPYAFKKSGSKIL